MRKTCSVQNRTVGSSSGAVQNGSPTSYRTQTTPRLGDQPRGVRWIRQPPSPQCTSLLASPLPHPTLPPQPRLVNPFYARSPNVQTKSTRPIEKVFQPLFGLKTHGFTRRTKRMHTFGVIIRRGVVVLLFSRCVIIRGGRVGFGAHDVRRCAIGYAWPSFLQCRERVPVVFLAFPAFPRCSLRVPGTCSRSVPYARRMFPHVFRVFPLTVTVTKVRPGFGLGAMFPRVPK